MATNMLFVVATRKTESEREDLPIIKSFKRMTPPEGIAVDTKIFFENKEGLSSLYNTVLDEDKDHDLVVFVHDDLWLNDCFMFEKLIDSMKRSDLIGICGGKSWEGYGDGETQPIIWTHAGRKRGLSGFMAHAADEKQDKEKHDMYYSGRSLFSTNFGYAPSQVLTIDGCFICFTRKAMDSGLRFDEDFKFHYYDMDLCFSAFTKKLTISTSPILATHESLGFSVMQTEFMEAQKRFLKKWF